MKANSEPLIQPFKEMEGDRKHLKDLVKFLLREGVYDGVMEALGTKQLSSLFRENCFKDLFDYNWGKHDRMPLSFSINKVSDAWRDEVGKIKRAEIAKDYDELGRITTSDEWFSGWVKVFYDKDGLINKVYVGSKALQDARWYSFITDSRVRGIIDRWAFSTKFVHHGELKDHMLIYVHGFNDS